MTHTIRMFCHSQTAVFVPTRDDATAPGERVISYERVTLFVKQSEANHDERATNGCNETGGKKRKRKGVADFASFKRMPFS